MAEKLAVDSGGRLTAESSAGGSFTAPVAGYINGVFARSQALLPPGLTLYTEARGG